MKKKSRSTKKGKLKVEITRTYPYNDKEFRDDAEFVILYIDGKEVLVGDWYHNNIEHRIEGFLAAMDHFKIPYVKKESNVNSDDIGSLDHEPYGA